MEFSRHESFKMYLAQDHTFYGLFTNGNVNSADYGIWEHVTPTHLLICVRGSQDYLRYAVPICFNVRTWHSARLPPSAAVHSDMSEGRALSSYR